MGVCAFGGGERRLSPAESFGLLGSKYPLSSPKFHRKPIVIKAYGSNARIPFSQNSKFAIGAFSKKKGRPCERPEIAEDSSKSSSALR
jgi:hypothetical protein